MFPKPQIFQWQCITMIINKAVQITYQMPFLLGAQLGPVLLELFLRRNHPTVR